MVSLNSIEDCARLSGTLLVKFDADEIYGPVRAQPRRITARAAANLENPFAISSMPLEKVGALPEVVAAVLGWQ